MTKKKPYFPNNWREWKDTDESIFGEHTFDEFMEWRVANWELPSSVCCIIRTTNKETKEVKEYVYQRKDAAEQRMNRIMNDEPLCDIAVATRDQVHFLYPTFEDDDTDEATA